MLAEKHAHMIHLASDFVFILCFSVQQIIAHTSLYRTQTVELGSLL